MCELSTAAHLFSLTCTLTCNAPYERENQFDDFFGIAYTPARNVLYERENQFDDLLINTGNAKLGWSITEFVRHMVQCLSAVYCPFSL